MTRKITMLLFAVLLIFSFAGTVLAEGGGDCADAPSVEPVGEMPVMDIDVDTGVIEADPDVEQVLPEVYETPELDYAEQPAGEDVTAQSSDSEPVADLGSESTEQCPQLPESDYIEMDEELLGLDENPVEQETMVTDEVPVDPYFRDSAGNWYHFYGGIGEDDTGNRIYYSGSQNPIQFAIDFISAENIILHDEGIIFVESGIYSGNVTLDGLLPYLSAIKGIVYDYADAADPLPTIRGNVSISNLNNGFIFEGFNVTGTISLTNIKGKLALTDLAGNIVLSEVDSSGNSSGYGALIENTARGNVTINNSAFNHNSTYGLKIETGGIVNINGISASYNEAGTGADISGYSRLTVSNSVFSGNTGGGLNADSDKAAPVTLEAVHATNNKNNGIRINTSGNIIFRNVLVNDNSSNGMYLRSKGVVTITDVTANNNGQRGLDIDNSIAPAARNLTLTRVNLTGNGDDGASLRSKGNVLLVDVNSNDNGASGIYIFNRLGSGSVTIRASRTGTAYSYSDNTLHGIRILSNGVVIVSDVNAYQNGKYGIMVDNASAPLPRNVVLTRINSNQNGEYGIYIESKGMVQLTDVNTTKNGTNDYVDELGMGDGENNIYYLFWEDIKPLSGTVFINDVEITGGYIIDYFNGIIVFSTPPSDKDEIRVEYTVDRGDGAYIDNRDGNGNVTIRASRAGTTYAFSGNTEHGIMIRSNGIVSVSDVFANNNGSNGISISNSGAPAARAVNLTRSSADDNGHYGISISSKGAVMVVDVSASGNGVSAKGSGLEIYNTTGNANVTIRASRAGTSYSFSDNSDFGIDIKSNGVVAVSDVIAEGNSSNGIRVINIDASGARAVTITRGSFNNNSSHGVDILSRGAVTLIDVSASGNKADGEFHHGVLIENAAGGGNVTIRSSRANLFNQFNDNSYYGVLIYTSGTVTISNIESSGNYGGLYIPEKGSSYSRTVTIRQGTFNDNTESNGLYIISHGTITLDNVTASNNKNYGAYLHNGGASGRADVVIRGSYNEFNDNGFMGLYIDAKNNVSLLNIICEGNTNIGADIYARGNVTVNSSSNFTNSISNNDKTGLVIYIDANGTVALTNLTSDDNGDEGIKVNTRGNVILTNVSASGNGEHSNKDSVTINNSNGSGNVTVRSSGATNYVEYSGNGRAGLYIDSRGTVVVSNVIASDNGNQGVYINNQYEPNPVARPVTVTRVFLNNNNDGLVIYATGTVTLDTVVACDNNADGVTINNGNENLKGNVIIRGSGNEISRNGEGLYIRTSGQITLANLDASDNDRIGANLGQSGHSAVNVTITNGVFNNNSDGNTSYDGLRINTYGNATLTNVEASDNGGSGIYVSNSKNLVMRNTLRNQALNISGNGSDGIQTEYLTGNISISGNIIFSDNSGNGAYLDLYDTVGNVTLSGLTFDGNILRNLFVSTGGSVTLTNVRADNSEGRGAQIQSFNGGSGTVRLTGRNSFSGNHGSGLIILTDGHVNLRGVTADGNGERGIDVSQRDEVNKLKSVLLQDVTVTGNKGEGIYVGKSDSDITFNNVKSFLNTYESTGNKAGIYINVGSGTVTFINSAIIGNYYYGIHVRRQSEQVAFRNTQYFGNNLSNTDGYVNVWYQP